VAVKKVPAGDAKAAVKSQAQEDRHRSRFYSRAPRSAPVKATPQSGAAKWPALTGAVGRANAGGMSAPREMFPPVPPREMNRVRCVGSASLSITSDLHWPFSALLARATSFGLWCRWFCLRLRSWHRCTCGRMRHVGWRDNRGRWWGK
jgi:hypothetical protein